ncbi:MAG: hypothetical protein OEO21_08240 [Candidatus Krumholzibacteria bacterium]|nr:hypothetical protein [Candidatus Krumholzibacteria bacterium]
MSRSSSIAARAVMALVLMVGFYLLALVIVAALLLSIYVQIRFKAGYIYFVIVAGIGAVTILVSIIPRPERFDPPWPKLTHEHHPELSGTVRTPEGAGKEVRRADAR